MKRIKYGEKLLLLGSETEVKKTASKMMKLKKFSKSDFVLHYVDKMNLEKNDLEEIVSQVSRVFIVSTCDSKLMSKLKMTIHQESKPIYILPSIEEIEISMSRGSRLDDDYILEIQNYSIGRINLIVKRIFDIVFSFVVLVSLTPLYFTISLLIFLQDKGPAFFIQERPGLHKKSFNLIKFRSMSVNQPKNLLDKQAVLNDSRITNLGKIIRATRIDELPQFLNVLKGEMSIVGPRPLMMNDVNQATKDNPEFIYRYNIKPGITGLQQVKTRYNSSWSKRLKYDLIYIQKYNFLLDIYIVLMTFKILFDFESGLGKEFSEDFEKLINETHRIIVLKKNSIEIVRNGSLKI